MTIWLIFKLNVHTQTHKSTLLTQEWPNKSSQSHNLYCSTLTSIQTTSHVSLQEEEEEEEGESSRRQHTVPASQQKAAVAPGIFLPANRFAGEGSDMWHPLSFIENVRWTFQRALWSDCPHVLNSFMIRSWWTVIVTFEWGLEGRATSCSMTFSYL